VVAELVEHVPGRGALGEAAPIVLPYALVDRVVEVEEFEILELAGRRREQLLAQLDPGIHRAPDDEEQQQLDRVAPLGRHMNGDTGLPRGAVDRRVDIELVGRALAREFAQAAQRYLDVAGAQLAGAVEILELALVPYLERALVLALAADPHALGIV